MSGIGFDAHISTLFAKDKERGFFGYVKTTLKEMFHYQPKYYTIIIDEMVFERNAFMVSIGNSSQFGNNAHLAPQASLVDGLLDVCIIKPFPLYSFPFLAFRMFNKTADRSKYVEIIKGKSISITREFKGPVHVDGEPFQMEAEIKIKVQPLSIKVLV